jgi:hypothetical protein
LLTKAIFVPSGDHIGLLLAPHALMNGFSPRSISLAPAARLTAAR